MPYKIIVADPSPSVQRTVQLAFPEPEFRLFPVEDGATLLDAAVEVLPDAVLLSLTLTGRDPGEISRLLRARESLRRVPLVLLRGTFEAADLPAALPEHDAIVQKPFDSERLAAIVRELIEARTVPPTLPEEPALPGEATAAGGCGEKEPV